MVGPDDLICATQTLPPGTGFVDRVQAAAAGGFRGIGLRPADREAALAAGFTDADLRAALAEHGVELAEIEVLRGFARHGEAGQRSRDSEEGFWRLADALGGRHLMAVSDLDGDLDDAAERLAGVCERALEHGLIVAVEFLPWTDIADAATAWEIVRRADRPNAGVLVDSWHHFRGAADESLITAIPPERIVAVQIDDADAECIGTLLDDTLHRRRLPGQGSFDLERFVRLLDGHGVRAPWSVELMSDDLHRHGARRCAVDAAAATRAVLARARS